MSESDRLLEGGSEFERFLLSAARDEAPPPELASRMMAVVGPATPPLGGDGGAAAPQMKLAPRSVSGWKWMMGTATVGLTLIASIHLLNEARSGGTVSPLAPAPTVVARNTPASPSRRDESLPAAELPTSVDVAPAEAKHPEPPHVGQAGTAPRSGAPSSTLSAELRLLDEARGAMARGDASRSLVLLNLYARRFPHGELQQEATVLRVKALRAQGDGAQADSLAKGFLEQHPSSAHVDRLRRERSTAPAP